MIRLYFWYELRSLKICYTMGSEQKLVFSARDCSNSWHVSISCKQSIIIGIVLLRGRNIVKANYFAWHFIFTDSKLRQPQTMIDFACKISTQLGLYSANLQAGSCISDWLLYTGVIGKALLYIHRLSHLLGKAHPIVKAWPIPKVAQAYNKSCNTK